MDARLLEVARAAKGFMPDDEGLALHAAGRDGDPWGLSSRSAATAGSRPCTWARRRAGGTVLFSVDHHRGSEENQAGWEHHDPEVVDPETGRMDTLPFFRRTVERAGLEDAVVAVVGDSPVIAANWSTPLGLVFVDGGHALDVVLADFESWSPHVAAGGVLVFHDVFEDRATAARRRSRFGSAPSPRACSPRSRRPAACALRRI